MHYLDYAATTPVDIQVAQVIMEGLSFYSNPSSVYQAAKHEKHAIQVARDTIQKTFNFLDGQFYFTSGASEANNWALIQQALIARQEGLGHHIVTTAIEHPSVLEPLRYLETLGFTVTYLQPLNGVYSVDQFVEASTKETCGWVCMAVNNEVGSVLPIKALGKVAKEYVAWYHVDAVQWFANDLVDLSDLGASTISISAHKIYGPKGIGGLFYQSIHPQMRLTPYLHGGGQERGMRSGTENTAYIKAFAKAVQLLSKDDLDHKKQIKDYLFQRLDQKGIPYQVNGTNQVDGIVSLYLPNLLASQLLIRMDMAGIAISAGSACSAGSLKTSHVLAAYYPKDNLRHQSSIRLSFGRSLDREAMDAFIDVIENIQKEKD